MTADRLKKKKSLKTSIKKMISSPVSEGSLSIIIAMEVKENAQEQSIMVG